MNSFHLIYLQALLLIFICSCSFKQETEDRVKFYEYKSVDTEKYEITPLIYDYEFSKKDSILRFHYKQVAATNQFEFLIYVYAEDNSIFKNGFYLRNGEEIKLECLVQKKYKIEEKTHNIYLLHYKVGTIDGENYVCLSKEFGMIIKKHQTWNYFWQIHTDNQDLLHLISVVNNDSEILELYKNEVAISPPPVMN